MRLTAIIDYLDRLAVTYEFSPQILSYLSITAIMKAIGVTPDTRQVDMDGLVRLFTPEEQQKWADYQSTGMPPSDWFYLASHLTGYAARLTKLQEEPTHARSSRNY